MKNKLLGIMSVAALSSFGWMANTKAVGEVGCSSSYEASITGSSQVCYDTLENAVASVEEGVETTIVLNDNVTLDAKLTLDTNKLLTINLNSKKISGNGVVLSLEKGSLKLTGTGEVNNTGSNYATVQVMSASDSSNVKLVIDQNVKVTGVLPVGIFGQRAHSSVSRNVIVQIDGTLDGTSQGLSVNGKIGTNGEATGPKVIINPTAVIKGTAAGIYQAGYSDITINGASVEGYSGIVTKAGVLNLNNANVKGTGNYVTPELTNTNGFTATGSAIQIESNKVYAKRIEVNINDGDYTSSHGYAIETSVVDIAVDQGTFKSNIAGDKSLNVSDAFKTKYENKPFIAAGTTFTNNGKATEDVLTYTDDLEINEDGVIEEKTYNIVTVSTNGEVKVDKVSAKVGDVVTVTTLANEGYELDTIQITYENTKGENVIVNLGEDGTFKMPEGNVKIVANFKELPKPEVIPDPEQPGEDPAEKDPTDPGKGDLPENPATLDNIAVYGTSLTAFAGTLLVALKKLKHKRMF